MKVDDGKEDFFPMQQHTKQNKDPKLVEGPIPLESEEHDVDNMKDLQLELGL
jgi:hypothetical protein